MLVLAMEFSKGTDAKTSLPGNGTGTAHATARGMMRESPSSKYNDTREAVNTDTKHERCAE